MGTRSRIGIKTGKDTFRTIYCGFDGYLDGVGAILKNFYTDINKINTLLDLGDISSLGEEIGSKHDFDSRDEKYRKWCLVYGRDRDEEDTEAQEYTFAELREDADDFTYIFDPKDGKWRYMEYDKAETYGKMKKLR